jgi:predicted HicB family RNase H-like nuclease
MMKSSNQNKKNSGHNGSRGQVIVRFRASNDLHERLKSLAEDEEMSLAGLVKKLVLDSLKKFPS